MFTAISTNFGYGDYSTTFTLPDLRGRVVAGLDSMGGSSASRLSTQLSSSTIGQSGGSQTHTLNVYEMPSHTHSVLYVQYFNAYVFNQAVNVFQNPSNGLMNIYPNGGDYPHNNVQPTMVMNYIIYAGV